ncbi:TNF receptor-associated factor 6 isoform X2 [Seriola dumerili]|uniref:TNF receptor-associated factor 6 isoform X2 n=1 Tax=Seriola dumerili TaxID=41447 RepID=UPI000BBF2AEB|nr:TNF receptor-associated factor 6 isoform X2 [Seriola dumerili]
MACFDSSKGSLEEDSYEGAVGGELSGCALAMMEKERESLLSPSENHGTFNSSSSSSFQAATPLQGYDVEFDPSLESKYECPICLMALRNAVQTPCGHRFCKNCIEKSIRDTGQRCPVDNEMLSEDQLFPDNFAKREILSLTVRCPNSGCADKMELRHLENHLALCQFATVPCPQCQQSVRKSHLEEHTTVECQRRPMSCPDCVASFVYEDRELHEQQCPFANVKCQYCEMDLIRDQMESHCDTDCPKAPIACNFSTFGCKERMQRHNLAQHMQEFTQMHMRYMAEFLRGLSLNGTTPKSLWALGPSVSSEDQGAAALVPASSGPRGPVSCSSNCAPSQPSEEMQRIRDMDGRLVKQDHQLRELIIFKETQGAFDAQLTWPLQGTIRLAILDHGPEGQHHMEVMETKPDLQAFQKPTILRNPKGFGYVTFMHLHQLNQRAYVKDDTMLIRCEVTPRFDNMPHREGPTVQPRGPEASVSRD